MLKFNQKGLLVVLSSPSGAGKTTIAKKILSKNKKFELSVSLTTRIPRKGEIDGKDYKFVSRNYFKKKINTGSFLEHAKVFDNLYGTLKSTITNQLKKGKNILLDIDWQGARQVKKNIKFNLVTIFILPPSLSELKKRLMNRERSVEFVKNRMSKAKREIKHWKEYDYAIVNRSLNKSVEQIEQIILVNKLRSKNNLFKNIK